MEPNIAAAPVRIVLDTNAVLDWLLFDNPAARRIGRAIESGEVTWCATAAMRDEHFEVLQRRVLQRWSPDADSHRRVWRIHCRLFETPERIADIHCADADDQMFVDLSLDLRPAWLLSRDKALLALARPLLPLGVRVATPAAWSEKRAAAEATALFQAGSPPARAVAR